jgi:phage-related protein (TIGR01555 family)
MSYKKTASGVIVPDSLNVPGRKIRDNQDAYGSNFGGLTQGGFYNALTGAGTGLDKTEYSFFLPTRLISRNELETLYIQSWAAAKFIDIPIDDMFILWREFINMSEDNVKLMKETEKEFCVEDRLNRGMKAGRLYGTGLVLMITKEAPLEKPLNVDRIRRGDLLNLLVVDRFDATVLNWNNDYKSKYYGQPETYKINLRNGGTITIHASRVLRFDGFTPLSQTGWHSYDQTWGVSSIIPVVIEINQDANISKGVAHMVNEASIPVQKVEDFADAVAGAPGCEMTIEQRMQAITMGRSIYRTTFMDKDEDLARVEISFAGLPEILDRSSKRLAAAEGIPATRFMGQPPIGMNATGESDMKNYAMMVESNREKKLTNPLYVLDQVLSRHAGVDENVEYEFPSLLDMSDTEKAAVFATISSALVPIVQTGILTEDEGREILDGNAIVGNLELEPDELDEITEFRRKQAQLENNEENPQNVFL